MSAVVRIQKPEAHFTMVPNALLRDPRLSMGAKGLWAYLNSHRDGFELSQGLLLQHTSSGKDHLATIKNELKSAGWMRVDRPRDPKTGQMSGTVWILLDGSDHRKPDFPTLGESRKSDEPVSGESAPKKKNEEEEQKGEESRKRALSASEFPADWTPDYDDRKWAFGEGFSDYDLDLETRKLLQHDSGKRHADLSKRWRKWMLQAVEFRRREVAREASGPGSEARLASLMGGGVPSRTSRRSARLEALMAQSGQAPRRQESDDDF